VTKAIDVQLNAKECKKVKTRFDSLPGLGIKSAETVSFTDKGEAEKVGLQYSYVFDTNN
jgi:recombinational DNA repair protein RecR